MQEEVNEKVIALSVKGTKTDRRTASKSMKFLLSQIKKQTTKAMQPRGKQTLKQLMKQTRAFPTLRLPRAISKPLRVRRKSTVSTLR